MKLTEHSELHVVTDEGVSVMTLTALANAFAGGLKPEGITIYSEPEEAEAHYERIRLVRKGTNALKSLGLVDLANLVEHLESQAMDEVLDKVF